MTSVPTETARAPRPTLIHRLHLRGVQNPKYYYIAPPSIWAVVLYVLSLLPLPETGALRETVSIPYADKLGHMAAYALLALLIIRGWHREKMPPIGLHGFVWLLCFVFGIMIEMQQGLSPHRSFQIGDIAANGVGALAGQALWQVLMWRWGRRTPLYPGLFRPRPEAHPSPEKRSRNTP
jgi:VanZ family protein